VGLHTGEKVCLTLRPAAPGVGIVFPIQSAGVEEKYVARRFIRIKRPIEVGDG
jgi:UDP-3-O-acyl-N-acetylglucosamine deacetylase